MNAQQEYLVDEIVGIVGDNIILYSEVEQQYQQSLVQGIPDNDLQCQVLDNILLQKLLKNQAELDSLVVTEQEVEGELDNRFNYYLRLMGGSVEKFEEYYGKTVLEFKQEFRPQVKELLLAQNMRREIVQNVKVTPNEVKRFFADIPKDSLPYFAAEAEIAHLVMKPDVSPEKKAETWAKLEELRDKVRNGEADFASLAKIWSQDGSAANGGALGFMKRGELVPEFEAVAYKMKPGEVSDVVETQFGLHIIQLEERLGNRISTSHILIKPEITNEDINDLKDQLEDIRSSILADSIDFATAVSDHSIDEQSVAFGGIILDQNTGSGVHLMDQMDSELFFAIDGLKEGEISEIKDFKLFDGTKAYRILKLKRRTKPHVANLDDDYTRIMETALQVKQDTEMIEWIQDKVDKTYVRVSDNYDACSAMQKWKK